MDAKISQNCSCSKFVVNAVLVESTQTDTGLFSRKLNCDNWMDMALGLVFTEVLRDSNISKIT